MALERLAVINDRRGHFYDKERRVSRIVRKGMKKPPAVAGDTLLGDGETA